ncbi:Gfo/Idh/MocA family protein [Liquorilactobacillus satsumensis]|uniref:Oxidoreductase n=1 Tax=Liquorilactobacillus satsumensis DSM 16230 = JCM 12392 TaxID=1423801 RepID=A0A0R1UXA1_9LACO|nr:Gfo/Idh/MocA family oxidoreductase [Liquorilactobacillus satsumensis]KRL97901.1 oxidoreductase [Liquorilactobacillus satsumensis DSM 16230 = JCM 12392]MCP9329442.1 Gfo/Idh/MocA family oxidoreductase [Liquorilactobacillus satsumensis]
MLKLGVIGTGWITKQFVEATQEVGGWQLTSVFSRNLERASAFAADFAGEIKGYRDLDTFFAEGDFDVVYIASPNSLHFAQARQAILADKHVIVEKPACSNPNEMKVLIRLLRRKHHIFYFEAARHFHEPNFKAAERQLRKMKTLQGATLTYLKYSSRFDDFLAGSEPNVFSLDFSGGALQDLGVYLVYDAVSWFGMPQKAMYFPHKLRNGIDGKGVAILQYADFEVTLNLGKTATSYLPSEIYGARDTLWLDNAAELKKVTYFAADGSKTDLTQKTAENPMVAEVKNFTAVLQRPESLSNKQLMEDWLAVAVQVNRVLYSLRQSAQLQFRADFEFR